MMGNAPSNRRVTVVNDDVVGVVQVSEGVVRRLRGLPDKQSTDSEKSSSQEQPVPPSIPEVIRPTPNYLPFAPPEPYSSTLEQRQKYHEEFKKAEKSWNNRIHELETQNRMLYETANEKFGATLKEVEENHVKNSYAPVCPDIQQKVIHCYKENTKLPLNCSQEVHDLLKCVEKVRMTALSK
ncbi:uncharacterized protein TNIN_129561 [Trichonephila inaurata madagascariensis]|uniref:MICOS complex subunit MIC19 n=1 Tax=Trichonephila inaurata madagascariensis TaxID=2747483 RepID=A0A8X6WSZ9_9ARAC|nr:uncharacterized protein TNIN_129561 [Trichonephila inaurata madagascariensis]